MSILVASSYPFTGPELPSAFYSAPWSPFMTLLALVPLFAVLWMVVWRGGKKLNIALLTQLPPAPLEQGGGFGNAIVGTLLMVGLATLITLAFWEF